MTRRPASHASAEANAAQQLRATSLTFPTENGWKVVVSAKRPGTYQEIEQALEEALAEVQHRIRNNVQLY